MDGSPCGGIENTQCYIHLPGQGHRHMIAFSMCMFWNDEHHDDIIRRPEFPTFGPISYILPGTHLPWCCPHPSQSSSVWWHCGRTVRGSFPKDLSHSVRLSVDPETLPVLKPKQEGMANITAVGINMMAIQCFPKLFSLQRCLHPMQTSTRQHCDGIFPASACGVNRANPQKCSSMKLLWAPKPKTNYGPTVVRLWWHAL